jgi:hypothetical protein
VATLSLSILLSFGIPRQPVLPFPISLLLLHLTRLCTHELSWVLSAVVLRSVHFDALYRLVLLSILIRIQPVDFDGDVNLFHFVLLRCVGKGAFGKVYHFSFYFGVGFLILVVLRYAWSNTSKPASCTLSNTSTKTNV